MVKSRSTIGIYVNFGYFELNDFVQCQSSLFAPICNGKRLNNSYKLCYQLFDLILISFMDSYTPMLVYFTYDMNRLLCPYNYNGWKKILFEFDRISSCWSSIMIACNLFDHISFNWIWNDLTTVRLWFCWPDFVVTKETECSYLYIRLNDFWSCLISNGIIISSLMIHFQIAIGC